MFEDIASGKEESRFVLIQDRVNHRGNCIMNHILQRLLDRLDVVVLYAFDKTLQCNCCRLYIYDAVSDPLGWIQPRLKKSTLQESPFLIKNILTNKIMSDENFNLLLPGKMAHIGIVIYSLSTLIHHCDITAVCKDLYEVAHYRTSEFEVHQTVAVVHSDLHEENILSSLNYIASTCIQLEQPDPIDRNNFTGMLVVTHCKMNGKICKKIEPYSVNKGEIEVLQRVADKTYSEEKKRSPNGEEIVPGLTFSLSLTEEQKKSRDQLHLPYLLDKKIKQTQLDLGKKGQIFYEADEADDLDEEDPDDDLNF